MIPDIMMCKIFSGEYTHNFTVLEINYPNSKETKNE